jgi:hypothetical protein
LKKAKEKVQTKVLIVINCSLAPAPEAIVSYLHAQIEAGRHGILSNISVIRQTINGFLVGNSITTEMLKDKTYTHAFLASDDTVCEPDILVKLVSRDKLIISGVYRKRDPKTNELAVYGKPGEPWDEWVKEGKLIPREFSSGHSMLVKREVFEKVVSKFGNMDYIDEDESIKHAVWIPYVDPKIKKIYLDDWAFSQRAKEAMPDKQVCWIDCSVKLTHRCEIWLGL